MSAAGKPAATSCAKLGPESTPPRTDRPSSSAATSCGSLARPGSNPLQSHTRACPLAPRLLRAASRAAPKSIRRSARDRRPATRCRSRRRLRAAPEKHARGGTFSFLRAARIAARWPASRAQSATACRRASEIAMAVPQAPAPNTAIFIRAPPPRRPRPAALSHNRCRPPGAGPEPTVRSLPPARGRRSAAHETRPARRLRASAARAPRRLSP